MRKSMHKFISNFRNSAERMSDMEITIDIDRLRDDLEDYYGTGAFSGMPAMMMEVSDIQRMSDEEVVRKAQREGFDLFKYQV